MYNIKTNEVSNKENLRYDIGSKIYKKKENLVISTNRNLIKKVFAIIFCNIEIIHVPRIL